VKITLTLILALLTVLAFSNFLPVSASITTSDLQVTYGSSADPATPLIPANSTSEDYVNTTNPYAQYSQEGVMSESGEEEGSNPLYVLVVGDEEERNVLRGIFWNPLYPTWYSWEEWALLHLERSDEALVARVR